MRLSNVLSLTNQVEKSKFLNFIDKISNESALDHPDLAAQLNKIDGQIKSAHSDDVVQLFLLLKPYFKTSIKEHLAMLGAKATIITNILVRDGNCISKIGWLEELYSKEWEIIDLRSKNIKARLDIHDEDVNSYDDTKRLQIYLACIKEAYSNDEKINREAKISDDERGILNVLARQLDIAADDLAAIEHLVEPIPQNGSIEAINALREIGLLFINKKRYSAYIPDEMVMLLNSIKGNDVRGKHFKRVLRTFSNAELSNTLKSHRKPTRGFDRAEKIRLIMQIGMPLSQVLSFDMFVENTSINDKKERLKGVIFDLSLKTTKLGLTLSERTNIIVNCLNNCTGDEFNSLSATGFKGMYDSLQKHFPNLSIMLKNELNLEDKADINVEILRGITITPHDILYFLKNEEIKEIADSMGVGKRGDLRLNILNSFADATDKMIENYGALARRDLAHLKNENIDISEADIGVKFEEVTKAIFEQLGLNVDEDARKAVSTSKEKTDIIISLSDDDIIIGEAKTCKNGDFGKYSSTSRQVKSYVSRCENAGKKVAQVLIVAPSFSEDFILNAEMDTEINISLLEADGLKMILDAYKSRRNPNFSAKLFTKGGLLKTDLIAKNI
jgi:hypothetical protein